MRIMHTAFVRLLAIRHCRQRRFGAQPGFICPALCDDLLQRLGHSRILQECLAARWVHGELGDGLGEVLLTHRISSRGSLQMLYTLSL